ncbi:MAG: fibronectin type III domain-containing protein, partial [Clostridiales bacterium]|nr:fibronectin type III domain-containing protein [Clostridiales bacterium]
LANAATGVKVSWGKVTGASGYYVYRKTSGGTFSKIATVTSGSTVSYTDKTAKSGTTYYYTVRAYKGGTTSSYVTNKYITR